MCGIQTYRVPTIRDLSEKTHWRYVGTTLNSADDASWGLMAEKLWLNGPAFLKNRNHGQNVLSDYDPEVKKTLAVFGTAAIEIHNPIFGFMQHFSSWDHLKRATARLLQFKDLLMHLSKEKATALTRQQPDEKIKVHNYHLTVEQLARADEALLQCVH